MHAQGTTDHAAQRAQWHAVLLVAFSLGVIYVAWRWLVSGRSDP